MTQKWNLQDIRPAEPKQPRRVIAKETLHKTISRTPANGNGNNGYNLNNKISEGDGNDEDTGTIVIKDNKKTNRFNFTLVAVAIIVLLGGAIGLSMFFSKTTLTVFPESREPNVNAEFVAYPDKRSGMLNYEIMTLDDTGERQVKASGQQQVEEQAKGFIEIIKTTPGTERLIKNTRFRSPEGFIFRIQESVVVPGSLKDASGTLVPGTIRAEVFADAVGQEYNLPSGTKFDIPGFKDSNLTELYNGIRAENREAFTGGFNGPRFIIDENELSTARQSLQMELRDKLLSQIDAKKPADFVAFDDAVTFTYNQLPTVQFGDNLVTIREQAVLQLPLFKHTDLASFLAKETITTYAQEPVRIRNIDDLKFSYTDSSVSSANIANLPSLTFNIVGKPLLVWEYNSDQLQKDLAGKPMTALQTVLPGYPGIVNADITGKPFWKRSFPSESKDINIIEIIKVN